ncbi:hypothetical protein ES708_15554 [subsurface metagenome]
MSLSGASVGEADIEHYILNDGTEAFLLTMECIKETYRRSLYMNLLAKDKDSNGWVISASIVGGKNSKIPKANSELTHIIRSHILSFCFDKTKLVGPKANGKKPKPK